MVFNHSCRSGKAVWDQLLVNTHRPNQRVFLQERQRLLNRAMAQKSFDVPQMPGTVKERCSAGLVQLFGGVDLGQAQQTLQHAEAFNGPVGVHRLGPVRDVRTELPAPIEQILDAAFDDASFVTVQVFVEGIEAAGLAARMNGNELQSLVEHSDQSGIPARPDRVRDILRRHRIISLGDFDVAVPVNLAWGFTEDGKKALRQWLEGRLFEGLKALPDLLASRAMNAGISGVLF